MQAKGIQESFKAAFIFLPGFQASLQHGLAHFPPTPWKVGGDWVKHRKDPTKKHINKNSGSTACELKAKCWGLNILYIYIYIACMTHIYNTLLWGSREVLHEHTISPVMVIIICVTSSP